MKKDISNRKAVIIGFIFSLILYILPPMPLGTFTELALRFVPLLPLVAVVILFYRRLEKSTGSYAILKEDYDKILEELTPLKSWEKTVRQFEFKEQYPGVFVYKKQPKECSGDEEKAMFCTRCFNEKGIHALTFICHERDYKVFRCLNCKAEIHLPQ